MNVRLGRSGKASQGAVAVKNTRNAEQTRARILEVARQEFAAKGYNGARVDEIVARCGVSKNLIYHYFDSKEALFIAVMELTYQRMREHQSEWNFTDLDPVAGIKKLTILTFEHFISDSAVVSLLNTENLHGAKHIKQSDNIQKLYDPLIETINHFLRRGEESGIFRNNVDPIDLYITISGLSYFYISNSHTLSYLFDQNLMDSSRLEQRKRHVCNVVLGYLRRE